MTEGMSYIYRLCDNTFFLIDGGWPESDYEEADKLYQLLCKAVGPNGKILPLLDGCLRMHMGIISEHLMILLRNIPIR